MHILVSPEDEELLRGHKWLVNNHGYVVRYVPAGVVILHRVIAGAEDGDIVDHINGNRLDNRRENLRICTQAENLRNRKVHRNNRLGVKGVYLQEGRFRAQIRADGKKVCLGYFSTAEEAARAYAAAAQRLHGEFARFQ